MKLKRNQNNKFFEALKEGLKDVLAHKQGKLILKSETIKISEPSREYYRPQVCKKRS